jgi:hypothetical protein
LTTSEISTIYLGRNTMAGQRRYKISYLSSDGRLEETVVEATTYMNKDGLITFLKEEGPEPVPGSVVPNRGRHRDSAGRRGWLNGIDRFCE